MVRVICLWFIVGVGVLQAGSARLTSEVVAQYGREVDRWAQRLQEARKALKNGEGCQAQSLLTEFPSGAQAAEAGRLLTLAEFVCNGGRNMGAAGEAQAQYVQAASALQRRESSTALYSLLVALNHETPQGQIKARNLMEAVFTLLGETDSLTQQYRPLVK